MNKATAILTGAALTGAIALLLLKVGRFSDSEHERFQGGLWRLKHLDTAFNQDLLKARFALLENYDDFQSYDEELRRLVDLLGRPPTAIDQAGRAAIEEYRAQFAGLLLQRQTLFERFKTKNALLANSRRYLPVALDELAARLGSTGQDQELIELLGDVARLALLRQSKPEAALGDTSDRLRRFNDWLAAHPGHPEARLAISLIRHLQNIVTGSGDVDTLTRQLLELETAASIAGLFQAYDVEVTGALQRARQSRSLLHGLGLVMLAGIAYVLWALRAANSRLEHRVGERTRELQLEVAERRRSEHTVAESQQFLQSTLDALSAHIAILDAAGVILSVNAKWHRFALDNQHTSGWLGAGENYLEVCDRSRGECAEEAPAVARGIRAVLAGELAEFALEYPCHSPHQHRWFIVRVTCFGTEVARRIVIAHENITERKLGEARLRAALHEVESQQFALNESSIVAITDRRGRITHANDSFCAISQYSRAELLGQDHRIVNAGHHPKAFFQDLWATIGRGQVWRGEVCNRAKDGSHYWVATTIVPFKDESGVITQHVVIRFDITARKRQEEELQRAQAFLNSVIENLPVPVFIKEARELRFVLWNKAGENLTGIPNHEMVGKCDHDFFPAPEAEKFIAIDREVLRSGEKLEIAEEQLQTRHKGIRTVHVTKVPVTHGDGQARFLLGIAVDITERKAAEAKLSELNQRLRDTSRQAGMAEVATGVLHNVGNVLNSVNVSATLLGDRLKQSKAAGFAKVAALVGEHAADLPGFFVNDTRAAQLPGYLTQFAAHLATEREALLGEVENLRKNIDHIKEIVVMQQSYANLSGVTELVKPAELIEDSLRMNAGALDRHAIEVVKELEDVAAIVLDKHKVLQILVNFVRNAKYACDDSGRADKRIVVRLRRQQDRVQFAVSDNGVGIPAGNLGLIFNHGFTTRKDGHGFGLHSGANAAREMGGAVTVASDGPGCGACFTLELPLIQEVAAISLHAA